MTSQNVGVLSCRNHPLLPYFLEALEAVPGTSLTVVLDAKGFSDKDLEIFRDRTRGAFPPRDAAVALARRRAVEVPSHNGPECLALVEKDRLGLLVNAGTPRIIKPDLIRAAAVGILNVHPGILPKYRGATCCEWAIHNGDPVGVTAHFMNEEIDGGPVLFARELPVRRGQSYEEVRAGLYQLTASVMAEAVRKIFETGARAAALPPQPPSPVFKPISDDLLAQVRQKLAAGGYGT